MSRIVWPRIPQGVTTIIVVSLFLGAIQLLSLAFLAEYVGKIFEEVKRRPQFIVTKLLNFEGADPARASGKPSADVSPNSYDAL
jgi:dolichol-phosphate mannosyltransferase